MCHQHLIALHASWQCRKLQTIVVAGASGCSQINSRVVVDGNLLTSKGPGTALEFALALVALLFGPRKAEEVAGPMVLDPDVLSRLSKTWGAQPTPFTFPETLQGLFINNWERSPTSVISLFGTDSLYISYIESCRRDGAIPQGVKRFSQLLEYLVACHHELLPMQVRREKGMVFKGLRLRDEARLRSTSWSVDGEFTSPGASEV